MARNHSDETFDTSCSPCQKENKRTDGDLFCLDCQDYYCTKCFEFHKKMPALSSHKLIGKSEFHSKLTKGSLPIVPTEQCTRHATKVVDIYCTDHKIVGCDTCMTLEHTSCKKLYVPEHIESLMKFMDINGCNKDCADIGLKANGQIKAIEENLRTLKNKKGNALNDLKSFKKELIDRLDEIEKRTIKQLDTVCEDIESKWTDTITVLQRYIKDMDQYISKLNSAAQNQSQQFVCASFCKMIASSAKQQAQEIHPNVNDITCIFTPCLELQTLIMSHKILGTSIMALNHSQNVMSLQSINNQPTNGIELADLIHVETGNVPRKDWGSPFFSLSSQNMTVGPHRFQTPTNRVWNGNPYICNVTQQTQFSNPQQFIMNQQISRVVPCPPSGQNNKGGSDPTCTINVSILKDIELHKAEKAWKPCCIEPKDAATTEVDDAATAELYKKTRSILNKLMPQKFDTLLSQMQALPIDTESKLKGVINLVFEKAISEPSFSVAYANMCRCLSLFKVSSDSGSGEVNFRTVLLTKCQLEFEKDSKSEDLFITKRKEIEKCEEGPKRDELKAELEYEETKARRRSLGNIRFIGELFKLKMLTENIMHTCLLQLLKNRDEENLECLCRLLTTVGKELDFDQAKPRMDQYFKQMSKIVNEKKTTSRVRFMLQDVIDLRLCKWIPRQTDNNPKTIDQIHKEMEQEAHDKTLQAQQSQMQQKSNRGGRRGPPEQRGGGNSDGWNTVGGARAPLKSVDRSIDPSKMKLSKQNVESIQLGPSGGAAKFSGWIRGSTGGTLGRPSLEKERPSVPANRFSALSKPEEESSRRNSGSSPARGEGRGHGGFGRPPQYNTRNSQESEKVISSAKATDNSQSDEVVGRDRERGQDNTQSPQEIPMVKDLTPEEVEKRAKAIFDEYITNHDTKEAIACIGELSEQNHHQCVYHFINHVLERSNLARKHTGQLLHDLVQQGIISIENYIKGLVEVLEYAEDMEIDIPKIWQYYGELISPMIQDGGVPLSFLKQAAQPLINNNKAGILLAEILLDASHREGRNKVGVLWKNSGLQWSDFMPKSQIEQLVVAKRLEFTRSDSVPKSPPTGLPMPEIWNQLHTLIVDKNANNETVFDWIESNVDEPTRNQSHFKRALMTAVCSSGIIGIKGNEKVDEEKIRSRYGLLLKYLDHKAESELQALYAVQALITKLEHPPGLLRGLFDILYDEDIISEDSFLQWERSDEEPDGKGAATKQTQQFFTWLRESEDS